MKNTGISWADHTFNPWWGCAKVSAGCKNCYAETLAGRFGKPGLWRGERMRTKAPWAEVLRWDKEAQASGVRRRVFCASMADFFELHPATTPWRGEAWDLIRECAALDWLLLTKRPQNIRSLLPTSFNSTCRHVWLGTSIENQETADERISHLLKVPARIRFLSYEPALGPVEISKYLGPGKIDWVIYGGESGADRRPDDIRWAQDVARQCKQAGAAFFYKQSGHPRPGYQHPDLAHLPQEFPK